MKQNLCMLDCAITDSRSAPAMLRGYGDGREKVWLDFENQHSEITDLEVLMALFAKEARYGRVGQRKPLWLIVLLAFVIFS